MGKALEKQRKTIEEQGDKQIEAIKELGRQQDASTKDSSERQQEPTDKSTRIDKEDLNVTDKNGCVYRFSDFLTPEEVQETIERNPESIDKLRDEQERFKNLYNNAKAAVFYDSRNFSKEFKTIIKELINEREE